MRDTPPPITQLEMTHTDFAFAKQMAAELGYAQTAYTTTSSLWGLFCLRDKSEDRAGCIIKTKEFGFMFVSDLVDLNLDLNLNELPDEATNKEVA